ncbi:Late expression factor 7 [Perigonia lusca single nucleopolyhedrovirus]|uniref:Late expression factor 7 n=1 Tax=Perigonia lusca single nucleopolyhedrovirus TaxID=1675865 RepID=A0A0M3N1X8_9ABAC|nr:Late expression factor 7 [Perigonia lusca single nucleopolyhedrovirus]AKN80564.1 Late expression factor 7 [Perigonia lusca single nucleopolyhedrovirus]
MSWPIRMSPVVFRSRRTNKRLRVFNIRDYLVSKSKVGKGKSYMKQLPNLPIEIVEYIVEKTNDAVLYKNVFGTGIKSRKLLLQQHELDEYFKSTPENYDPCHDPLLNSRYNDAPIIPYLNIMVYFGEFEGSSDFFMYCVPKDVRIATFKTIQNCQDPVNNMMCLNFTWWRVILCLRHILHKFGIWRFGSRELVDKCIEDIHRFDIYIESNPFEFDIIADNLIRQANKITIKTNTLNHERKKLTVEALINDILGKFEIYELDTQSNDDNNSNCDENTDNSDCEEGIYECDDENEQDNIFESKHICFSYKIIGFCTVTDDLYYQNL